MPAELDHEPDAVLAFCGEGHRAAAVEARPMGRGRVTSGGMGLGGRRDRKLLRDWRSQDVILNPK